MNLLWLLIWLFCGLAAGSTNTCSPTNRAGSTWCVENIFHFTLLSFFLLLSFNTLLPFILLLKLVIHNFLVVLFLWENKKIIWLTYVDSELLSFIIVLFILKPLNIVHFICMKTLDKLQLILELQIRQKFFSISIFRRTQTVWRRWYWISFWLFFCFTDYRPPSIFSFP